MAQNWTHTLSTIGTASRNFIDVAAFVAALPTDLRTGGGVHHTGHMFADSNFTDILVQLRPATPSNVSQSSNVTLMNAPGEKPIWKPASGTGANLVVVQRGSFMGGIVFDGATFTISGASNRGLVALDEQGGGDAGSGPILFGCIIKNSNKQGIVLGLGTNATAVLIFCLAFDNTLNGYLIRGGANRFGGSFFYCGSGFNGAWGYGIENATPERFNAIGCWARGNTSGSFQNLISLSSFTVIDDQRFTDLGLTLGGGDNANVLENASQVDFAFVNEAGRDFTPGSGSILLGQGHALGQQFGFNHLFDVNLNRLQLDWGDRLDVGPIQSKIVAAITPPSDTPTTAIAAFLEAIRSHFANSTSFLSFIQSVNALETTNGHVFLGYDPKRITENFLKDKGPVIAINWDSDTFEDVSLKTFDATAVISADLFYFEDQDVAHTRIAEVNFLGKMQHELLNIGFLDSTFQGQIDGIVRVTFERDEERPSIKQIHSEISIIYGSDDAS